MPQGHEQLTVMVQGPMRPRSVGAGLNRSAGRLGATGAALTAAGVEHTAGVELTSAARTGVAQSTESAARESRNFFIFTPLRVDGHSSESSICNLSCARCSGPTTDGGLEPGARRRGSGGSAWESNLPPDRNRLGTTVLKTGSLPCLPSCVSLVLHGPSGLT